MFESAVEGNLGRLRCAIAGAVDLALRIEPLSVDFFGGHELAFAVGSGFVDMPAFDQFLVTVLRFRALLVLDLRNVLIHRLSVRGISR